MMVESAFVSGSLGRAVFYRNGHHCVLDARAVEPREPRPNEIYMFRHVARELISVHPEGLPVPLERVREVLDEEVKFFKGLDGLLIGMDSEMPYETRLRGISRANQVLAEDEKIARRIAQRFWVPVELNEWDPEGGMKIAQESEAVHAEGYYRPLVEGVVDKIIEAIELVAIEKHGSGVKSAVYQSVLRRYIPALVARIQKKDTSQALILAFNMERRGSILDLDVSRFFLDTKDEENWYEVFDGNSQKIPQKSRTIPIGSMGLQF